MFKKNMHKCWKILEKKVGLGSVLDNTSPVFYVFKAGYLAGMLAISDQHKQDLTKIRKEIEKFN